MEITVQTFLIVCPFLFLAGLIDAIGGGGGLISLPAYLIAGFPPHTAIATNKLSSACGTSLTTYRFIRKGLVNFKLAVPTVVAALLGASIGANISLSIDDDILLYMMVAILPVCAFLVLNRKLFRDGGSDEIVLNGKLFLVTSFIAFVIGMYDGFYGPGTGTFLIIAFTVFTGMSMKAANAQAKVINLTSNITSFVVFLLGGEVIFSVGLAGAACNMLGGYIGAGLVMKKGSRIVKPSILFVLFLLALKVFGVY